MCVGQHFILGYLTVYYTVHLNYGSLGIVWLAYCRERRTDGDVGQRQLQAFSVNERESV